MREIKFRAWFKDTQEMKSVATNNLYMGNKSSWMHLSPQPMSDYRLVEIMQYTGLKDKNGVEVFEGDIIQLNFPSNKKKIKVEYSEFHAGYLPFVHDGGCGCCAEDNTGVDPFDVKVIGDIHQNPELLGDDK